MTKIGKGAPQQTTKKKTKRSFVTGRAKVLPPERQFQDNARPHLRRFTLETAQVQLVTMLKAHTPAEEQQRQVGVPQQLQGDYLKSTQSIPIMEAAIEQCSNLYHSIVEQPVPETFVPYTSEHDLLYFYAKVKQHLGTPTLSWRQCQYVLFRNMIVNKLLYKFVYDLADDLHAMLQLCMHDQVVCFKFDYQKENQKRGDIQRELTKVMFHLIIETLALADIDIRLD